MKVNDSLALWCKFSIYFALNLSNAQISNITGANKKTVAKYRKFKCEADVLEYYKATHSVRSPKRDLLKLHEEFFISELNNRAGLSNSQIMDHFREKYPDVPEVSRSVLSRYLADLRGRTGAIKAPKHARVYRRCMPEGPGTEAQVDFGETFMFDLFGRRYKVYFLIIVLSFSKFKFIYLIGTKFDSEHAVYALHRAFEYFGGYPEKVIFDQDRVWLREENLGDYHLTKTLEEFVREVGFTPVFCRPYDPESKGRVEKYVHFVKDNFLKGREFVSYEQLNREADAWLKRTGNGQKHDLHGVSPSYLFYNFEKQHLKRYTLHMEDPDWKPKVYTVNKDNTIRRNSCIFALPGGVYRGAGTRVMVDDKSKAGMLRILDILGNVIVEYPKPDQKNVFIPLPEGMEEEKMCKYEILLRDKLFQWDPDDPLSRLLKKIREQKGERYFKDAYKGLLKLLENMDGYSARRLIKYCAEHDKTTPAEINHAISVLHIEEQSVTDEEALLDTYDFSEYDVEGISLDNYNFINDCDEENGDDTEENEDTDSTH